MLNATFNSKNSLPAARHPLIQRPALQSATPLKARFTRLARPLDQTAQRRKNGASEDGMLGGMILDAFFAVAFPGFGVVMSKIGLAGFGATDVVDLCGHARDAFNPHAGQKLNRHRTLKTKMRYRRPQRRLLNLLFG